ncbi:glucose-1-phosphate cytidylyltransferase [Chloroflexota bacterium]
MEKPQVVILCGGKGSRLSEETALKPKPMVEIGGRPILWHIMKIYSHYGYKRFILALGYLGEHIKRYFYEYRILSGDFTLEMYPHKPPQVHSIPEHSDWEITLVDTGLDTLKGGRIKRLEKYITSDNFHLTYVDGVANINIDRLYDFHISHNTIGTVTVVRPPSRFGELLLSGDKIVKFEEKPQLAQGAINGGFFVFKKEFMKYLTPDVDCDFEFGALQKLAQDGELRAYRHDGFWQCMDNVRERDYLNNLWDENRAEWKVWK